MKALNLLSLTIVLLLFLSCDSSGINLGNGEARKLILQYYHLPLNIRLAIDRRYDNYGWPPEKYRQLSQAGLSLINEIKGSIYTKTFEITLTEKAREYWLQNGILSAPEGNKVIIVLKGYLLKLKDVNVSTNSKENTAEAKITLSISNISPFQQIFSPLVSNVITATINFKHYNNGWQIVENSDSKKIFQSINAPQHWAGGWRINFDDSPIPIEDPEISKERERAKIEKEQRDKEILTRFKEIGNDLLYDTKTGFTWLTAPIVDETWKGGIAICKNIKIGDHSDWHMASRAELATIISENGMSFVDAPDGHNFRMTINRGRGAFRVSDLKYENQSWAWHAYSSIRKGWEEYPIWVTDARCLCVRNGILNSDEEAKSKEVDDDGTKFIACDTPPAFVTNPSYQIPIEAKDMGVTGKVLAKIRVGIDGRAQRVIILESDSELFNQTAIDACMKATYTPAKLNGNPVTAWFAVQFQF